jgi:Transcriptional regulator containing an amidase domain and an AraC-type DNA-binding HTH domain
MNTPEKHRITILAVNDFVLFDLSVPYQIFSKAVSPDGGSAYDVCFAGPHPTSVSGQTRIENVLPLETLWRSDTVIVPGVYSALDFADEDVFHALRRASAENARLASICTGACILAASGILQGLRATTHWELADALASAYPDIKVEPDILFVDNGRILTSAGLASGIDLCLHIIRKDLGENAASALAEFFVVPLEREGRHAQLIRRGTPESDESLTGLQLWLLENIHLNHTLESISRHACMSPRTLNRKFQEQTGMAPMLWLNQKRIRRAQALLESTSMPVEQIAGATGYGSASAFRAGFKRSVGISPMGWRKTYSTSPADS